jgi:hypothetical protein
VRQVTVTASATMSATMAIEASRVPTISYIANNGSPSVAESRDPARDFLDRYPKAA